MMPNSPAHRAISASEYRFVALITLAVLLVTSLPYAYGYLSAPPDKQFMGLMLDVPDHGQYLSWWRSFQTSLLVPNKLTPEPNAPLFFNLLWWTLAQVSRLTGLGYAPLFQIFRWVAGASFLWALYRLIAQLLPETGPRRVAFLLTTFSSGLGWLLILLKYTRWHGDLPLKLALDVYVAEGNSFLCLLAFPHFTLALTLIALTFEFVYRWWRAGRKRDILTASLLALLLGWTHTYDLLIVYGVTAAFALAVWLRERRLPGRLFWGGLTLVALSCSGAVYSVILTTLDPLWERVLAQFANAGVYTPSPPHLFLLFGLPLGGALATLIYLLYRRRWSDAHLFLIAWFLAGAALNYIPTDFQIHMLSSWQIPLLLLVTVGLYELTAPSLRRAATAALLLLVLPTNLYLWTWRFVDLARHDYPYYLYRDEVAALRWLDGQPDDAEIVFSSLTVGQYLPALSGKTAFLAHWAQTVDFYEKQERVARFFAAGTPDEKRLATVRRFGVDYIFHGPAERRLGDYDPAHTTWLTPVFTAPQVTLYRVTE